MNKITSKVSWVLIVALILSLLLVFASCTDDIVGPQIRDKDADKDKKEDGTGEDPSNEGGGGMIALNNGMFLLSFGEHC